MKRAAILAAVAGACAVLAWRAMAWLAVDDCLDAGGAWDYNRDICRTQ